MKGEERERAYRRPLGNGIGPVRPRYATYITQVRLFIHLLLVEPSGPSSDLNKSKNNINKRYLLIPNGLVSESPFLRGRASQTTASQAQFRLSLLVQELNPSIRYCLQINTILFATAHEGERPHAIAPGLSKPYRVKLWSLPHSLPLIAAISPYLPYSIYINTFTCLEPDLLQEISYYMSSHVYTLSGPINKDVFAYKLYLHRFSHAILAFIRVLLYY